MTEYLPVPQERDGLELDEFLCLLYPTATKGYLRRMVREGRVLVDGERVLPSVRLRNHQVLVLDLDEDDFPAAPVAPADEVPVLYEDADVCVVDKPAGLSTEPERWARATPCLAGALLSIAAERRGEHDEPGPDSFRPRLVHRIDKETSGAVLVAKHLEAERVLRSAFEEGRVGKEYLALVEGEHPLADGESEVIDLPLQHDPRRGGRVRVSEGDGKPSRTRVSVERRFRGYTLLRCAPLTGRTHQIRVHVAARGFPLAVDKLYGRRDGLLLSELKPGYKHKRGVVERPLIDRLTLHASRIAFPGISTPGEHEVEAPLPKDLERVLKQLARVRALTR